MKSIKNSKTKAALLAGVVGSAVAVAVYLVIHKPELRRPLLGIARNLLSGLEGVMRWHDR